MAQSTRLKIETVMEWDRPMQFAFFDICGHHPDSANEHLVLADKMAPVRKKVREILATAERLDAPVLSTTCLGLQRVTPGMSVRGTLAGEEGSRTAFVPMAATEADVAHALTKRFIAFERLSCKTGDENTRRRTYDVFGVNRHAAEIVHALGDRHWLIFGAGFEHCLLAAVEGLRGLGRPVTVLADGCIHGGRSTPVTFLETLERIKLLGARWENTDTVFAEALVA
jgi:nicotinamidase-related amidase